MSTELVPYRGATEIERATAWADLPDDERKRQATAAANTHDADALISLTESWLILHGRKGAAVSALTLVAYREGVADLLAAWTTQNLLRPGREAAAGWIRGLEAGKLKPSTVQKKLSAAKHLYAALRTAGATNADPFKDLRVAPDPIPAEEKRPPYEESDIATLLAVATETDRLLVVLGAWAGLRNMELLGLRWEHITLSARQLVVQSGKGGRRRTVPLTPDLRAELAAQAQPEGYVFAKQRSAQALLYRMKQLCMKAGVDYKAIHSLRHTAGTRLMRKAHDPQMVQKFLGHSSISTAQIYIKYADDQLRAVIEEL